MPSVLRALVDVAPDARMDSVKLITLGGETLYSQDVRRARPFFGPDTVFQNRLGATEECVTSCHRNPDGVLEHLGAPTIA